MTIGKWPTWTALLAVKEARELRRDLLDGLGAKFGVGEPLQVVLPLVFGAQLGALTLEELFADGLKGVLVAAASRRRSPSGSSPRSIGAILCGSSTTLPTRMGRSWPMPRTIGDTKSSDRVACQFRTRRMSANSRWPGMQAVRASVS
jgi:hypothetical protein